MYHSWVCRAARRKANVYRLFRQHAGRDWRKFRGRGVTSPHSVLSLEILRRQLVVRLLKSPVVTEPLSAGNRDGEGEPAPDY